MYTYIYILYLLSYTIILPVILIKYHQYIRFLLYMKKKIQNFVVSLSICFFSILMSISNKCDRGYPVPFSG